MSMASACDLRLAGRLDASSGVKRGPSRSELRILRRLARRCQPSDSCDIACNYACYFLTQLGSSFHRYGFYLTFRGPHACLAQAAGSTAAANDQVCCMSNMHSQLIWVEGAWSCVTLRGLRDMHVTANSCWNEHFTLHSVTCSSLQIDRSHVTFCHSTGSICIPGGWLS